MILRVAAVGLIAAAVGLAGLVATRPDGTASSADATSLKWSGEPLQIVRGGSNGDRIVSGWVVNDSDRAFELDTADVALRRRDGSPVPGVATFIAGYAHGVLPMDRGPYPDPEIKRLGRVGQFPTGRPVRITVSWKQPRDGRDPTLIDYGTGHLVIPARR